jgi:hypothetical protein
MEALIMQPSQVLNEIGLIYNKNPENILTNFYWNNFTSSDLLVYKLDDTLVFLDQETDYFRAYFYSDNIENVEKILSFITEKTLVLEVISKEKPLSIISMLEHSSFSLYAIHKKIVNKTLPKLVTNKDLTYANIEDLSKIHDSLMNNFDKYSDHLPTLDFIKNAIENNHILIHKIDSDIPAYIIFEIKKNTCYFGYWFSDQRDNPVIGISLLINLYGILNEKNIKMAYGWVKDDNFKVIRIHQRFGFYFEGMENLIYLKKGIR